MEHGDCFSSCMKIGEKTINVKGKVGEEKDLKRKEIIFLCNCTCTTEILCWSGDRGFHCRGGSAP